MNPQARQELLALKAWHEAGREKSVTPSPPPRRATNRELLAQARDLSLAPTQRSRAAETLRRQVRSLCAATLARQAPQVTPAELEDLVQETLIRLLQSPPATDPNPAYIARVATNLLIDSRRHRLRRGQERDPISLDDTEDGHTVDLPDPEAAVEETVLQQIEQRRIRAAVFRLLRPTEATILLRRADGVAHEEIAAELGLSSVNVRKQAERGMKRLKEHAAAGHLAVAT